MKIKKQNAVRFWMTAMLSVFLFSVTSPNGLVKIFISGYADVLPEGNNPNPMLADTLGNYVTLLASDERGVAELNRLAEAGDRGISQHLRDAMK